MISLHYYPLHGEEVYFSQKMLPLFAIQSFKSMKEPEEKNCGNILKQIFKYSDHHCLSKLLFSLWYKGII